MDDLPVRFRDCEELSGEDDLVETCCAGGVSHNDEGCDRAEPVGGSMGGVGAICGAGVGEFAHEFSFASEGGLSLGDSRQNGRVTTQLFDRGAVFPHRLPEFVRVQPTEREADLVRWFWGSEWSFAGDSVSEQVVVPFSTCNLTVGPDGASITGPTTRASRRELRGTGWVMGTMLQPAAAFALVGSPAHFRNRSVRITAEGMVADVASAFAGEAALRVRFGKARSIVSTWLHAQIPEIGEAARNANRLVSTADAREDLNTVGDVASAAALSLRTAQRVASEYVGVSLGEMIRRRRAQIAFQNIREQPQRPIAQVAAVLGYADQAHLAGETRRLLGSTTSTYRRSAIERQPL